ncbi:MAG: cytidine deaminase, partial [Sphingomonadales bacterium]|nr:cytidine deaminase [Sphingomonadales bacterium]
MTVNEDELLDLAKEVRSRAYAPFSGYRVGAAILDGDGNVHSGCNVENAAYPEGICAETNAIGSMVAAGGKRIARIVIVGGRDGLEACT